MLVRSKSCSDSRMVAGKYSVCGSTSVFEKLDDCALIGHYESQGTGPIFSSSSDANCYFLEVIPHQDSHVSREVTEASIVEKMSSMKFPPLTKDKLRLYVRTSLHHRPSPLQ